MSKKTIAVLTLISEGCSYSQIVDGHPGITYLDIFAAAEEALRMNESTPDYHSRIAELKVKYPMAYEKWTAGDDRELASLHEDGISIAVLAAHFKRQPSAIRSRLNHMERGEL